MRTPKTSHVFALKRGFSLIELLVVVIIIAVLGVVSYVAIQRTQTRSMNERVLDDLVAIGNALEDFRRDHDGVFPIPKTDTNQNVLCFYSDATYAHDCDSAAFIQGMIDNDLLTKAYLREVPTDPRTGNRYVYGVSKDRKFYEVAGIYEGEDGKTVARTVENLAKGFQLPSLIRAYDGPNFVIDGEGNLPYSPDKLALTGTLDNKNGSVKVGSEEAFNTMVVHENDVIDTRGGGTVDIYFTDGSSTHVDSGSTLQLKSLVTEKNDKSGTVTKILLRLNVGKIWNKVVRLAQKSEFRVETNAAIAGVRGTEFGIDDSGEVKVKTGLVWGKSKSSVSGLSGEDSPIEALMAVPTPDPQAEQDSYGNLGNVFVATSADFQVYYQSVPLTDNLIPHILTAAADGAGNLALTVRNVNYFVNLVDKNSGLRHVEANKLAVYSEAALKVEHPTPSQSFDLSAILPKSGTPNPQSDPYTLPPIQPQMGAFFMRFEYVTKDAAGVETLQHSSGISPVPTLQPDTGMDEKQLYPNEVPLDGGLTITAPEITAVGSQFLVTITPTPNDGDWDVAPLAICEKVASSFNVKPKAEGDCVITAKVTLSDGSQPTGTKTVKIVPHQGYLAVNPAKIDPGTHTGTKKVTVTWDAPGFPGTPAYDFKLYVKGTGDATTPYTASSSSIVRTTATTDNVPHGSYRATVTLDNGAGQTESKSVDFDVLDPSAVSADFYVDGSTAIVPVELPDSTAKTLLLSAPNPYNSAYKYSWTASGGTVKADNAHPSDPSKASIDISLPSPGSAATLSITLTIRDNASGNIADSKTKTVTAKRLSEITRIGYVPYSVTVYAGDSLVVPSVMVTEVNGSPVDTPTFIVPCAPKKGAESKASITQSGIPIVYTYTNTEHGPDPLTCEIDKSTTTPPTGYSWGPNPLSFTLDLKVLGCGDGTVQPDKEKCESSSFVAADNIDCATGLPSAGGSATIATGCDSHCQFEGCTAPANPCGNGQPDIGEECDPAGAAPACPLGTVGYPVCGSDCRITGCTAPAQPEATLAAATPQGYYQKGQTIPLAATNISVLHYSLNGGSSMTNPGISAFTPSEIGTYTLTGTPNANAVAPAPLTIKVCGYVDGAGKCWSVATATAQTCVDVCGISGLQCSHETDWSVNSVCSHLGSYSFSSNTANTDYAPVIYNNSECRNDLDSNRDCLMPASGPYLRICKCQE